MSMTPRLPLSFAEPNDPIVEGQLDDVERKYGLTLPVDYKSFLIEVNGGRPDPSGFPIVGFENNPFGNISAFFGVRARLESEDLELAVREAATIAPAGIFPIAYTDCDDLVCIDLRRDARPIVFWDRRPSFAGSKWREKDLYPIADNFSAFLESLVELDDAGLPRNEGANFESE